MTGFALFLLMAGQLQAAPEIAEVRISSSVIIRAELAVTPEALEQGLMFRDSLKNGTGMLFVFEGESGHYFWMKDTRINLDIVYLNHNQKISDIFQNVPASAPDAEDKDIAMVHGVGSYVLELPAGSAAEYGLKRGQKLDFKISRCARKRTK